MINSPRLLAINAIPGDPHPPCYASPAHALVEFAPLTKKQQKATGRKLELLAGSCIRDASPVAIRVDASR